MLGRNVTYHPGTKMVKFITVNTVYAVGEDGKLRAIDTEATAKASTAAHGINRSTTFPTRSLVTTNSVTQLTAQATLTPTPVEASVKQHRRHPLRFTQIQKSSGTAPELFFISSSPMISPSPHFSISVFPIVSNAFAWPSQRHDRDNRECVTSNILQVSCAFLFARV